MFVIITYTNNKKLIKFNINKLDDDDLRGLKAEYYKNNLKTKLERISNLVKS